MHPSTLPTAGDVLVMDTNAPIRAFVVEVLSDEGYSVRSAANRSDGLAQILDTPPAVLLLDVGIRPRTCEELIAEIRTIEPTLPIVLLTTTPRDAEHLMDAYQIACVAKPFEIDELLECVATHVRPTHERE